MEDYIAILLRFMQTNKQTMWFTGIGINDVGGRYQMGIFGIILWSNEI